MLSNTGTKFNPVRPCGITFKLWKDTAEDIAAKDITLVEDKARRIVSGEDNPTHHAIIEGDNLLALNKLVEEYGDTEEHGKIDVIYIDPPYNRGKNDLMYDDDFSERAGERDTSSKWLSFMEPRLRLAKRLLKSDGLIFVSIGPDEHHRLRCLMDEVFWKKNFVSDIVWKSGGIKNDAKFLSNCCEYVLCYKKEDLKHFNKQPADLDKYPLVEPDGRRYQVQHLDVNNSYSPVMDYEITAPDGSIIVAGGNYENYKKRVAGFVSGKDYKWRFSRENFAERMSRGEIVFKKTKKRRLVQSKAYYFDGKTKVDQNLFGAFMEGGVCGASGTFEINDIFPEQRGIFQHPKPSKLISRLIALHPNKDATVLDFFAGSGTTGHAVMKQNAQDGGKRKFILVSNNEITADIAKYLTEKLGLTPGTPTYDDNGICRRITHERVKRVIAGYTTGKGKHIPGLPGNEVSYFQMEVKK